MESIGNGEKAFNWQELYILTGHWNSDLQFYSDDLGFLHHLIDKYVIWITRQENLDLVHSIKMNLFRTKKKCTKLLEKIDGHRKQLAYLIENPDSSAAEGIKTAHEQLEKRMADFLKTFRENRKEIFRISEYIIDSEKLANIMQP